MKCPTCVTPSLVMSERHGIEIDYCPTCRGVWLDRGELDKIIERSASEQQPPSRPGANYSQPPLAQQPPVAQQQYPQQYRSPDDSDVYPAIGGTHPPQKKRKSWLSDLFD